VPDRFPRIKKGAMLMARKDGSDSHKADVLFTNSYLGLFVQQRPAYWSKLLEMLYGDGRIRKFASVVEDIVEKFSFLALAKDQIAESEARRDPQKQFFVKYHTYSYIFMTKSFLDAVAVFINESYGLKFNGGNIDLGKSHFIESLSTQNKPLAAEITKRQRWIGQVTKYRNNLIHRHGVYVGPIPTVPESMTDPRAIDLYILEEPAYIPNDPDFVVDKIYDGVEGEFIKVNSLVEEWIQKSFEIFDLALSSFTASFEVVPRENGVGVIFTIRESR